MFFDTQSTNRRLTVKRMGWIAIFNPSICCSRWEPGLAWGWTSFFAATITSATKWVWDLVGDPVEYDS
jgi:hypothetical protein